MAKSESRFKLFSIKKDLDWWYLFGIDFHEDKCYFLKIVTDHKYETEKYSINEGRDLWKKLIKEGNTKVNLSVNERPAFVSEKIREWEKFARIKRIKVSSLLSNNPWLSKEKIEKRRSEDLKSLTFYNSESITYEEPPVFKEIGTNNSIKEWNKKGSRHLLYLMSKDTFFAIFAIDKLSEKSICLIQANTLFNEDKAQDILLLSGQEINSYRKALYNNGYREFNEGTISGLIFQRINEWIVIKNNDEDKVFAHLRNSWKEKYSEDKTPKRIELSYDLEKGYMDIEVKELIEYDEENESVFSRGSDSEPTENIDNYWNQDGVFENQSDQSF
mgnify:CR=1 FL=1